MSRFLLYIEAIHLIIIYSLLNTAAVYRSHHSVIVYSLLNTAVVLYIYVTCVQLLPSTEIVETKSMSL